HQKLFIAGMLAATALPFALASADDAPPPPPPHDHHGHHGPPPPEALAACKDVNEGATCAFTIHEHDVTGTCSHGPDGQGPLACKPDHPPGPPPEQK
ncbi:MAG TPA: hypothetical protein VGM90_25260, partial [Kofleriaceae bacterium]